MVCGRGVAITKCFANDLHRWFIVVLACINGVLPVNESISPERCIIWGSGLNADTVLPVRYFYIQTVHSNGHNLTVSPGKHLVSPAINTFFKELEQYYYLLSATLEKHAF